ncbi:MAG: molybdopterin-dependent oxidoreductase [Burkholderiaceae bacterium]|nr:molybdopterin-dependent oxidoreductase [Burkholderiaceae bacterium]
MATTQSDHVRGKDPRVPEAVQNSLKPGRWVNSTCKMCLHSCSIRVHVTDDGVINKIEGNPTNPSNAGRLCPKGNAGIMRHYDPQRFKQPLRRTNPEKGPGIDPQWEPISWKEALDITAREIKKSLDEDPRKIMPSLEHFQKMHIWNWALALGTRNFYQSGGTMCGGAYHPINGYIHSTFAAVNDAKYCNYWISDGAGDGFSSHLHAAAQSHWVAKARLERGMKVVAVEPRMSIAGAKAEEWIPIRPATDRQFAMSMSHVLVYEQLCDDDFLRKDTNAPYLVGPDQMFVRNAERQIYVWDQAADRARLWNDPDLKWENLALEGNFEVEGVKCRPAFQIYKDILKDCSPEQMEKITTIPAETVRRIAREFASQACIGQTMELPDGRTVPYRPAAYNYYRGAQGHKYGMMTNHAFQLVNMLVGNIDHPGGRCGATLNDYTVDNNHCAPGECGQMLGVPHQLGPMPPFSWPPNEYHLAGYFPVGVHPPHLNMLGFLESEKYGINFKPDVLVNCHSNPVWSIQGPREAWLKFLREMRFTVCVDLIPSEMTDFADIILPCHDYLETWNATMIEPPHTEGICFRQPVVPPLFDTKSEEEIFYEISERLGVIDAWNEVSNMVLGLNMKPHLKLEPGKKYTDREIAERVGLLWNDKPIEWYMEHGHSVTEKRLDKWYRPWEGMRLLFYIEDLVVQRETLRGQFERALVPFRHEWPFDDYQPLPLAVLDPIHNEAVEYNLYAITFKDIQMNFGETLSNPWIKDITYRDPVHTGLLINTDTAARLGFANGDIVRVDSPYGHIYGRLTTTEGIHHQTLGVSNALSRTRTENRAALMAGGHYNDMLPHDLKNTDGASGQPETSCRVKLTKLKDWPEFLKQGSTVYDYVDSIADGKAGY